MASVLDEMTTYLAAQGVGTVGTDLFAGLLPDTPDACVALLETGGMPAAHTVGGGGAGSAVFERPSIQVICRGAKHDYAAARAKAGTAFTKLDGLANTTLSGTRYLSIFAAQPPFLIGRDENERPLVGFNVEVAKELSA